MFQTYHFNVSQQLSKHILIYLTLNARFTDDHKIYRSLIYIFPYHVHSVYFRAFEFPTSA